jgi:hypothetical protein
MDRRRADAMQTGRVRHPARRPDPLRCRSRLLRYALQDGGRFLPGLVVRQLDEVICHRPPADQGAERAVHSTL